MISSSANNVDTNDHVGGKITPAAVSAWRNARAERDAPKEPLEAIARTINTAIILSLGFTKSWSEPI